MNSRKALSIGKNLLRLLLLMAVAYALFLRGTRPNLEVSTDAGTSGDQGLVELAPVESGAENASLALATGIPQAVDSGQSELFANPAPAQSQSRALFTLAPFLPDIPGYISLGEPSHFGLLEPDEQANLDPAQRAGLGPAGELAERMSACFAEAGAGAARVYRDAVRSQAAGMVGVLAPEDLRDAALVTRCILGPLGEAMLPSGEAVAAAELDDLSPCAGHVEVQAQGRRHDIVYLGSTARVCRDICRALEGCGSQGQID